MQYHFKIRNTRNRNHIRVYGEAPHRPVAILLLERRKGDGATMVHLLYLDATLTIDTIQRIWEHLTGHIQIPPYIAYIQDLPVVQQLAESVGFKRNGEYWQWPSP